MRYRFFLIAAILLIGVTKVGAQNATPVVFSPYSMYGLGELTSQGNLSSKMMGGAGVALYDPTKINYLNPAALGSVRRNTALFSFAGEGTSNYLTTNSVDINNQPYQASSANNSFSLNDLGLAFSLTRGLGISVSMNPVSVVGYSSVIIDDSKELMESVGRAAYSYSGEGGISSVNASIGFNPLKGLNIGVSANYYFGSINRYYHSEIIPVLTTQTYSSLRSTESLNFSKISGTFGLQYSTRVSRTGVLSLGATYALPVNADPEHTDLQLVYHSSSGDTVSNTSGNLKLTIPAKISGGIAFTSNKFTAAVDYSTQDWRGAYDTECATTGFSLARLTEVRAGVSYTPNRLDLRRAMNRWTYKLGFIYSSGYYTMLDRISGTPYSPKTIAGTLGFEIPLNREASTTMNIGLELGTQGTTNYNQVKNNYVKVFVGVSLFGDDLWFVQRKFN